MGRPPGPRKRATSGECEGVVVSRRASGRRLAVQRHPPRLTLPPEPEPRFQEPPRAIKTPIMYQRPPRSTHLDALMASAQGRRFGRPAPAPGWRDALPRRLIRPCQATAKRHP
jgi:hypothetical protein